MPILNRPSSSGELEGIEYSGKAKSDIKKNKLCACVCGTSYPSDRNDNAKMFGNWIIDWLQIDRDTVVYLDGIWDKSPSMDGSDNYEVSINVATINTESDKRDNPLLDIRSELISISSVGEVALVKLNVPNKTIILVKLDNYLYFYEITSNNQISHKFSITYSSYPTVRAYETYSFQQILEVNYDGYINDGTFYDFYEFRKDNDGTLFSIDYCKIIIATHEFSRQRVCSGGLTYGNTFTGLITPSNRTSNVYYLFTYRKETVSSSTNTKMSIEKITLPKIGETDYSTSTLINLSSSTDLYVFSCDIYETLLVFNAIGKTSTSSNKVLYNSFFAFKIFPNYNLKALTNQTFTSNLTVGYSSITSFKSSSHLMAGGAYRMLFSYIGDDNVTYLCGYTYFPYKYSAEFDAIRNTSQSYVSSLKSLVVNNESYYVLEKTNSQNYDGYCKVVGNYYEIYPLKDGVFVDSDYIGFAKDDYKINYKATIIHPTTK